MYKDKVCVAQFSGHYVKFLSAVPPILAQAPFAFVSVIEQGGMYFPLASHIFYKIGMLCIILIMHCFTHILNTWNSHCRVLIVRRFFSN